MANLVKAGGGLRVESLQELSQLGALLAKSGFFQDAKSEAQCAVKVLAGLEMGVSAFAAMTGIHIIKGKPAAGAGLMAQQVKAHPNYDYKVLELTEKICKIEFFQSGQSLGVSSFTIEEAKAAGTQNLQKFPKNMLFARAISNGVRFYCPDVMGAAPVYTPEEMGVEVDAEGAVVEIAQLVPNEDDEPCSIDWNSVKAELGVTSEEIKQVAIRLYPDHPTKLTQSEGLVLLDELKQQIPAN